jgi:hypothetical protein
MIFDEHAIGRDLDTRVRRLLATHDPAHTEPHKFLEARFDTGLAWVQFLPKGTADSVCRKVFRSR